MTNQSLIQVLTRPSCSSLWRLRNDFLAGGRSADTVVIEVLDHFFAFLNDLSASMSAHEFSKTATLLDIGAVGGVAVQNLLESGAAIDTLWKRLLAGGVSEGLMVLASRQYVKSAAAEMVGVHRAAAWYLYGRFWRISCQQQPNIETAVRRQQLEQLFAPARDETAPNIAKAVLLGRLFQVLLLINLSEDRLEIGD